MSLEHIYGREAFTKATATGRVLVKLGADARCKPCVAVSYVLPRLARDFGVQVVALDVDEPENSFVRDDFRFASIPHFLLFVDGVLVNEQSSFSDYPSLRAWLRGVVSDAARTGGTAEPSQDTDDERLFGEAALSLWTTYQDTVRGPWGKLEPIYEPAIVVFNAAMQAAHDRFVAGLIDADARESEKKAARDERDRAIGPAMTEYQSINGPAYDAYVAGLKALCDAHAPENDTAVTHGSIVCVGDSCSMR